MLRTSFTSFATRSANQIQPALRINIATPTTRRALQPLERRFLATSNSTPKGNTSTAFTFTSHSRPNPTTSHQTILQRLRSSAQFFSSSRARLNGKTGPPNVTPTLGSPGGGATEPTTLRGRMAKLSREYGWSVLGVYFLLTALDFPFCYLLVRSVGVEKIGEYEHVVVSNVKRLIPEAVKQTWRDWRRAMRKEEVDGTGSADFTESLEMATWGVEEASAANKKEASLGTQLALAYAIHKSFIFVRVPLTAAITPKVVKVLRGWGWEIGKRTTKEAKALKRAAMPPKKS